MGVWIGVDWAWGLMGYHSREGSMVLFTVGCMRQETNDSILGEKRCREWGLRTRGSQEGELDSSL